MKKNTKAFFRSFYLSSVILGCFVIGCLGTARAYEQMRLTAFGEYKAAVEISDGCLRILDYEIKLFDNP